MLDVYSSRAASLHQLNMLAEWVRKNVAQAQTGKLDVISFVEIDLPRIFPGLYVAIESDAEMGRRRAYVSDNPFGIVVSESIYNKCADGCPDACEIILHEVGHVFLHYKYKSLGLNSSKSFYTPQIRETGATHSAEWQATNFAMCLLYPYSHFKKYTKRLELQVYYDLGVQNSDRLLAHLQKLRLREDSRERKNDRRWCEEVVSNFPKFRKRDVKTNGSQLELFFRTSAITEC